MCHDFQFHLLCRAVLNCQLFELRIRFEKILLLVINLRKIFAHRVGSKPKLLRIGTV